MLPGVGTKLSVDQDGHERQDHRDPLYESNYHLINQSYAAGLNISEYDYPGTLFESRDTCVRSEPTCQPIYRRVPIGLCDLRHIEGAREVGAYNARNISPLEVSTGQDSTGQVCIGEVRPEESSSGQVGISEVRIR